MAACGRCRTYRLLPNPVRDGIFGLAFGMLIGLGLALLVEALDTRVRSGDEVAERLGVPLLGRLPEPPRKLRERNALVMLHDLESAAAIESELELSRRMAAIGRLTSGVGHEVKNPINAIVVHLELLKTKLGGASGPAIHQT